MNKGKFRYHAKGSRQQKPTLTIPQEPKEIVHLEFCAPGAKEVSLAGSFNGWDAAVLPMKRVGDATWAVDLELKPGRHEYRFVVGRPLAGRSECRRPDGEPTAKEIQCC